MVNKVKLLVIYILFMCGSWSNVIQERFDEVTQPAYEYVYLHAHTCYDSIAIKHTCRMNISGVSAVTKMVE